MARQARIYFFLSRLYLKRRDIIVWRAYSIYSKQIPCHLINTGPGLHKSFGVVTTRPGSQQTAYERPAIDQLDQLDQHTESNYWAHSHDGKNVHTVIYWTIVANDRSSGPNKITTTAFFFEQRNCELVHWVLGPRWLQRARRHKIAAILNHRLFYSWFVTFGLVYDRDQRTR